MTSDRPCPRDGLPLERQTLGPAEIFVCAQCQGLWVGRSDLESFLRSPAEEWKLPWPGPSRTEHAAPDHTAHCPCDARAGMATVKRKGVRVDVCPQCSAVWLDGGELRQLLERSRGGADGETSAGGFAFDLLADVLLSLFR